MNNKIIAYYNKIAEKYDQFYTWEATDRALLQLFCSTLQQQRIKNLFDLGCGSGRASHYFAIQGFSVQSIDQSSAMIAAAKKLHNHDRIMFQHLSIEEFLSKVSIKNKAGIMFSFSLIHHSPDEVSVILKKVRKYFAKGSIVFLAMQITDDNCLDTKAELLKSRVTKLQIPFFSWNKKYLEQLAKKAGFEIIFSMTRSPWQHEWPREKGFLLLKIK